LCGRGIRGALFENGFARQPGFQKFTAMAAFLCR
jgi:hypothetical protein